MSDVRGNLAAGTLVLISRTGGGIPDDDELARISAGRELEVLLAVAPWRPSVHTRGNRDVLVFPTATPWGDVIAGCAEAATSERIVFAELPAVQSLARVPELLDELDDADVAGARLLRHDGVTLESAGGGFSSLRYAFALESGTIATTLLPERRQVLWVDRRAFAARREALLATGPPHWSTGDTLAEADWGWRLSLTGHRVIGSPILIPIDEGVGAARHASALEEEGRRVRAGIALLATMLGDSALHRALVQNPAAAETLNPGMSGIVRRRGESDTGRKRPQAEADARESLALSARLGTAVRFAEPELAERRAAVQTARTRTDAALAKALGTAFDIDRPSAVARIVGPLVVAERPRVAILCSDVVGDGIAGPAIRALESARVLREKFDVQIGVRDATASIDAPCPVRRLSTSVVRDLLAGSDAIVLQGPVSEWYPEILASDVPIAVDLYDPMNLESLESRHADQLVPYTTKLLRDQVARGDFFFCASERQRDYWIGMLAGAGRVTSAAYRADPDLRQLVDVVPFGIPDEPPVRTAPGVRGVVDGIGDDDPLFLWNGGLWGWFEPELFIRAIDMARDRVPNVRAYFMGVRDPRADGALGRGAQCDRTRQSARAARHARLLQRLDAVRDAPERLSRRHGSRQLPPHAPRDALLLPHPHPRLHLGLPADHLQLGRRPRRPRAQRGARHHGAAGGGRGRRRRDRAHRERRRAAPGFARQSRGTGARAHLEHGARPARDLALPAVAECPGDGSRRIRARRAHRSAPGIAQGARASAAAPARPRPGQARNQASVHAPQRQLRRT